MFILGNIKPVYFYKNENGRLYAVFQSKLDFNSKLPPWAMGLLILLPCKNGKRLLLILVEVVRLICGGGNSMNAKTDKSMKVGFVCFGFNISRCYVRFTLLHIPLPLEISPRKVDDFGFSLELSFEIFVLYS